MSNFFPATLSFLVNCPCEVKNSIFSQTTPFKHFLWCYCAWTAYVSGRSRKSALIPYPDPLQGYKVGQETTPRRIPLYFAWFPVFHHFGCSCLKKNFSWQSLPLAPPRCLVQKARLLSLRIWNASKSRRLAKRRPL